MKSVKKIFSLILVLALSLGIVLPLTGCGDDVEKLVIYNWEEYIDETVLDEFAEYYTQKTGKEIEIVYSKFDTNETMLTKVMNGDASIDVMCPSEYAIEKLVKADKIEKLNKDSSLYEYVDNVDNVIYEKVADTFGLFNVQGEERNINDYFVPYMWGTLGILYNAQVVSEEEARETGWGLLWNEGDNPALHGQIYMKDSIRDAYAAAVLYAKEQGRLPLSYENKTTGELINSTGNDILKVAEAVLREQKSELKGYEVDFGKSDLARGVGYVNLAWSGDALYAIEDLAPVNGIELAYFTPDSGANIWFDGWVVSKDSKNKSAAMEFINYMCKPEVAIKNAIYIGYTSAVDKEILSENDEVINLLSENDYDPIEFFENEARYPVVTDVTFGVMQDFGDKNETLVTMWERVKATGDNVGTLIVAFIVVVAVWLILISIVLIAKKSKKTKLVKRN